MKMKHPLQHAFEGFGLNIRDGDIFIALSSTNRMKQILIVQFIETPPSSPALVYFILLFRMHTLRIAKIRVQQGQDFEQQE